MRPTLNPRLPAPRIRSAAAAAFTFCPLFTTHVQVPGKQKAISFCLPVWVCLVFLSSLHRIPMKTGRSEWPMNGSITSHKLLAECVLAYRHIKNFHQCVGKCFPKCTTWRAQQSSSPKKVSTKKSAMLGLVRFPRFPKSSIASANVCVLFCVNGVGLL